MSIDDEVLARLCRYDRPVLIVRTYLWDSPTLTLGVHQPECDIPCLLETYRNHPGAADLSERVVRRPTGGRAILHDQDISFSFLTNDPVLNRLSLKDSYRLLNGFVTKTLNQMDISLSQAADHAGYQAEAPSPNQYVHSAVCFETRTPSDLLADNGRKIAGSAQLRRAGALLQQGTCFLESCQQRYDRLSQYDRFHHTLVSVVEVALNSPARVLNNREFSRFFSRPLVTESPV